MMVIESERKYCVVTWDGVVVRQQVTMRQAVVFCVRRRRGAYDIAQRTERGLRLISWVADPSLYE